MTTAALEYVSDVWGYQESPVHFGNQFNIEEFISHSSIQIEASRTLFQISDSANDINQSGNTHNEEINKNIELAKASPKTPDSNDLMDTSESQIIPDNNIAKKVARQNSSATQNTLDNSSATDIASIKNKPINENRIYSVDIFGWFSFIKVCTLLN